MSSCGLYNSPEYYFERKIVIIFLPVNLNMGFGYSEEQSH